MHDYLIKFKKSLRNLMMYFILNNIKLDKFKIRETTNIYEFFAHVFRLIKINPRLDSGQKFHIDEFRAHCITFEGGSKSVLNLKVYTKSKKVTSYFLDLVFSFH